MEEYYNDDEYDFNDNRGHSPTMYRMRTLSMLGKITMERIK